MTVITIAGAETLADDLDELFSRKETANALLRKRNVETRKFTNGWEGSRFGGSQAEYRARKAAK